MSSATRSWSTGDIDSNVNQKIREYAEEDRGELCGAGVTPEAWGVALTAYLDSLAIGHALDGAPTSPTNLPIVLQRLLNFAVGLEFRDDAPTYNRAVRQASLRHTVE